MSLKPLLAALISLVVPGLGQIYAGKSERGAAILISVIIDGNLNAIWLSIYSLTSPGSAAFWTYTLPRILHDWFAAFLVIFLIWQVMDAYRQASLTYSPSHPFYLQHIITYGLLSSKVLLIASIMAALISVVSGCVRSPFSSSRTYC